MTLTTIDPNVALLVIDLQRGFSALPFAEDFMSIVMRAARLADQFRAHRLPVVLVNNAGAAPGRREHSPVGVAYGPDWTDLVPELGAAPDDVRMTKRSPGAFTGTGLGRFLLDRDISQVVVAGVATGTGVEMTARQAYELGFNITAATDAMTDTSAEVHANSVGRILPRIGETGRTDEVIALLGR